MSKTIIVGGGIIGLCSAYYLQRRGHDIQIIERGDFSDGCSFGNMGYICPSHFIPLASPGIISQGIRYMLNSKSPFYIKPRLDKALMEWVWHFYRSSNASNMKNASPQLFNILSLSRRLIDDIKVDMDEGFEMNDKGCLMMCKKESTYDHELRLADDAEKMGLIVKRLNKTQVQELENEVEVDVTGAVLYKDDCLVNPVKWMACMKRYLENKGVIFSLNTTVTGFEKSKEQVRIVYTDKGSFDCDNLVVSAGSWLPVVAKLLNLHLLVQPGKGYSYTYDGIEKNIHYPALLIDTKSAITPWGQTLRIGGTMELSGINKNILEKRVHSIYEAAKSFYPGLKIDMPPVDKVWSGLRPLSPDGLPYIGKPSPKSNVVIAGGHAMLGIAQAPGTGLLVSQLVSNQATEIPVSAFDIKRFGI